MNELRGVAIGLTGEETWVVFCQEKVLPKLIGLSILPGSFRAFRASVKISFGDRNLLAGSMGGGALSYPLLETVPLSLTTDFIILYPLGERGEGERSAKSRDEGEISGEDDSNWGDPPAVSSNGGLIVLY